jgi:hypothetical protein
MVSGSGAVATSQQGRRPHAGSMKRLRTPDRREGDPGDPDRKVPSSTDEEGGLETGFEPTVRDRQVAGIGVREPGDPTEGKPDAEDPDRRRM